MLKKFAFTDLLNIFKTKKDFILHIFDAFSYKNSIVTKKSIVTGIEVAEMNTSCCASILQSYTKFNDQFFGKYISGDRDLKHFNITDLTSYLEKLEDNNAIMKIDIDTLYEVLTIFKKAKCHNISISVNLHPGQTAFLIIKNVYGKEKALVTGIKE